MNINIDLTIDQIVEDLGEVRAVGSTHIDDVRYRNLRDMGDLVYILINKMRDARQDKGRPEYSMNLQGELADNILKELKELLEE